MKTHHYEQQCDVNVMECKMKPQDVVNMFLCSIKCKEFLDKLIDYWNVTIPYPPVFNFFVLIILNWK
jgi:hypothetical protein